MKKLVELKEERRNLVTEMDKILNTASEAKRDLTEDEQSQWDAKKSEVEKLDTQIERAEEQERLNQSIVTSDAESLRNPDDGEGKEMKREFNFGKAINEMAKGGNLTGFEKEIAEQCEADMRKAGIAIQPNGLYIPNSVIYRADPYKSTSNTDILNKKVADSLSVAKSNAQALLESLGVRMYTGLNGSFVAPAMDALDAGFVDEDSNSASFGVTTSGLKLEPRRIGGNQAFTREFLNQANTGIYDAILQDMNDAIWRAIASDLFDQFASDALDASVSIEGSELTVTDVYNLQEAKLGGANGKYVAPFNVANYLKTKASVSDVAGPIWYNGTIDGYDAIRTEFANKDELYFGNWANAAVGMWGPGIEIIVDPYSSKNKAEIEIAINALADTGIVNPNSFKWIPDASI